jgi:hypothetical protein
LLVDWFMGALGGPLVLSSAALPGDVSGRGSNVELCSLSVGLIVIVVVDRFGTFVVDGVEAKYFGTSAWTLAGTLAANSAGVAGMGRHVPLPRYMRVEAAVVGSAGSTGEGGWDADVGERC